MAVRLAGSAHFRNRAVASRRRRAKFIVAALLVIVVVLVLRQALAARDAKAKGANAAAVQPHLSYGAQQAQDVNLVAGAVGQYAAAYKGLPQRLAVSNGSLVLCAAVCDASSYVVGGFSVYQPADIKLVPYQTALTVPSPSMMYLVPGAKCASDGRIDGANPEPRSMVILFATATSSGTAPRCVVL